MADDSNTSGSDFFDRFDSSYGLKPGRPSDEAAQSRLGQIAAGAGPMAEAPAAQPHPVNAAGQRAPYVDVEFPGGDVHNDPAKPKGDFYDQFSSTPWHEDMAWQAPQGINRGVDALINLPYNLIRYPVNAAANALGREGDLIPEPPEYLARFNAGHQINKALTGSEEKPPEGLAGKFAGSMGEAIGSALPGEAALTKLGPAMKAITSYAPKFVEATPESVALAGKAATVPRTMGQQIGQFYAESPGAATALGTAAAATSGAASEAAKELGLGPGWEVAAGSIAPMAPAGTVLAAPRAAKAIGELTGTTGFGKPTLARVSANIQQLPQKARDTLKALGIHASADAENRALPSNPIKPGAQAAADQIVANQLMRANKTPDDLERALDQAASARRYNSSGEAQDVLGLVDLDPSLARLMGSIGRSNPEGANLASDFFYGRQSGLTPQAGMPAEANIPTKPMLGKPLTGKEAEEVYGHRFATQPGDVVPTGSFARLRDAMKRAFGISDSDFHGHAANANRTEAALIDAAEREATPLYDATRAAGKDYDLSQNTKPILDYWRAKADNLATRDPARKAILNAIALFENKKGPVKFIGDFDRGKQQLDDMISNAFSGDQKYIGKFILKKMKTDLLKGVSTEDLAEAGMVNPQRLPGVDDVTHNDMGQNYMAAREAFSSRAQSRDALKAGKEAPSQDPDSAKAAFDDIENEVDRKLFKLGIVGDYERAMGKRHPTNDATAWFNNHNTMDLLAHVIERSKQSDAVFANRPERLGRYVGLERNNMRSERTALQGSQTSRNDADNEALEGMHSLVENTISKAQSDPTTSASLLGMTTKALKFTLNKFFGYRADTSAAVARNLLSADPELRSATIARLRERMGADRFSYFQRVLNQQMEQASVVRGTAAVAPNTDKPEPDIPRATGGSVPGAALDFAHRMRAPR